MTMSIEACLAHAKVQLERAKLVEKPTLEAEILLAFVLQKPRSYFYTWPAHLLDQASLQQFNQMLSRRLDGEPIAYITGTRAFWNLAYTVSKHTLIPRPETELLVETALNCYREPQSTLQVADLGTGSGAIALALAGERPNWTIHASDICDKALAIAKQNAMQHGFRQITFHQGHWLSALPAQQFDMIVSNPPYLASAEWPDYEAYLRHEPYLALVSGEKGLNAIEDIINGAPSYLKKGGYLILEHGFSQGAEVRALFLNAGYQNIKTLKDFALHERLTLAALS